VANIFISYSSQQRDLTRELATVIEAQFGAGSVWWDQTGLRSGDRFSPEITSALDAAKVVVVVWTQGAVASDWVYAEATRAASQRKIVTVRAADLDPKLIPLPFNVFHTGLVDNTAAVLDSIEKRISGEPSPLPSSLPGNNFRGYLLDPKQESLPLWGAKAPASLLLAKYRLVPFDDFHGICANLIEWATGTPAHAMGSPVLGRFVHAPAGLGKTRALIEVADALTRARGWLAGFLPRGIRGAERERSEGALERLVLGGADATGLMVIVDYAESRQEDVVWLADQLIKRTESNPKPARLVLLSRGPGIWWRELVNKNQSLQQLFSLGGDLYDELKIPVAIYRHDRQKLFDASVKAFGNYKSVLAPHLTESGPAADNLLRALETEADYDRPLAVQIAALLHVAGVDVAGTRHGMASLLDMILGLEYAHWDAALGIAGKPNLQTGMKNGVAQVTLVGHVNGPQQAEALIARDPFYGTARDIDVPRVRDLLASILPGANDWLVGLEPDLIGEHHVAEVATDVLVDACLDWVGDDRNQRQQVLTVLNRATRTEHGTIAIRAEGQLDRLVRTRAAAFGGDLIEVARQTPGRLLALCVALEAQIDSLDETALAAMDASLSYSLTLTNLALRVAERRAKLARRSAIAVGVATSWWQAYLQAWFRRGNRDLRAQALDFLAGRVGALGEILHNLGRHEEALAATQEAVDIRRHLAQTRPAASLPALSISLEDLGQILFSLGRQKEALTARQEAVEIDRLLAQTRPDIFLPNLTKSLDALGDLLSHLGQHEEALAASQEAVEIARRLAQTGRDAFLSDLAISLSHVSARLSDLGQHEEALAASQEAVEIARREDASMLAIHLNNLSLRLSNFGRHEEALEASQEAVEIDRRLAQARPDTFLLNFAASLGVHSNALRATEQNDGAAAVAREGLTAIAPYLEKHVSAYGGLGEWLRQLYFAACEKAGTEPDQQLIKRITIALKENPD
jgi:tetratricopeptide (TPR) repeat protein